MTGAGATYLPSSRSRLNWRALVWQAMLVAVIVWLGYEAINNAAQNMRSRNIPTDFAFWLKPSGFDINQSLIEYSARSSFGRAFLVGLLNTLAVAGLGIVLATIIGFFVGVARLSSNWMVAKLAAAYVEILRNTPLLLQLLFWYNAVLKPLPLPRQSLAFPQLSLQMPGLMTLGVAIGAVAAGYVLLQASRTQAEGGAMKSLGNALGSLLVALGLLLVVFGAGLLGLAADQNWSGLLHIARGEYAFLNNRGLFLPLPALTAGAQWLWFVLAGAVIAAIVFWQYAGKHQALTGQQIPRGMIATLIVGVPVVAAFLLAGSPVTFDMPKLRGFNLAGGWRVYPEFFALLLGLSLYTAAFIAEIVRAGILAVPKGQSEAANALGLRRQTTLKLVVIPQAMRVIVPPLTNQYLNLTKNSSLAVFVGYPDLVQVFAGSVLFLTGAAVQVVAITMAVYLVISLVTSGIMNLYNRRMAMVER